MACTFANSVTSIARTDPHPAPHLRGSPLPLRILLPLALAQSRPANSFRSLDPSLLLHTVTFQYQPTPTPTEEEQEEDQERGRMKNARQRQTDSPTLRAPQRPRSARTASSEGVTINFGRKIALTHSHRFNLNMPPIYVPRTMSTDVVHHDRAFSVQFLHMNISGFHLFEQKQRTICSKVRCLGVTFVPMTSLKMTDAIDNDRRRKKLGA